MNNGNTINILTTGKTFDMVFADLIAAEKAKTEGLTEPENARCYLCKRTYGDTSACLSQENETFYLLPLNLENVEIKVSEDIRVTYRLCPECLMLLSGLAVNYRDSIIGADATRYSTLKELFESGIFVPFEEASKELHNVRQGISPKPVVINHGKRESKDNATT